VFSLLMTPDDWQTYQNRLTAQWGLQGVVVVWGAGPREYPCLVASRPTNEQPPKVLSCFVLQADARELLAAVPQPPTHPEVGPSRAPTGPTQENFNRWATAHVLTIVRFLVDTGICKQDQYEHELLENIDRVTQWHGEDKERLRRGLDRHAVTVLESFDPPR
jgi:hypothetical protein